MASTTGTSDPTYDLISVLYHALQGAEHYKKYASDAEIHPDLATFFREVQQQDQQRAERTKELLASVFDAASQ